MHPDDGPSDTHLLTWQQTVCCRHHHSYVIQEASSLTKKLFQRAKSTSCLILLHSHVAYHERLHPMAEARLRLSLAKASFFFSVLGRPNTPNVLGQVLTEEKEMKEVIKKGHSDVSTFYAIVLVIYKAIRH